MSGTFKRKRRRRLKPAVVAAAAVLVCIAAAAAVSALWPKAPASAAVSKTSTAVSSSPAQTASRSSAAATQSSSHTAAASSKASSLSSEDKALLLLVNKDNPIPSGYNPQLERIPTSYFTDSGKENRFDVRAKPHLIQMLDDAKSQGVPMQIYSGYRTHDYQQNNYQKQVDKLLKQGLTSSQAQVQAANLVAPAGTSEHETGLSADIVGTDWLKNHSDLTSAFDQTPAYAWLSAHAAEYGFILRYPKGDESVTKYDYEPWHYRYVGIANAKRIKDSGLCLEDYLKKNPVQ